jgi:hypothetical protein
MAEPLSTDLRQRVVDAVNGGTSRRRAGSHFKVGASCGAMGRPGARHGRCPTQAARGRSSISGHRSPGQIDPFSARTRWRCDPRRDSKGSVGRRSFIRQASKTWALIGPSRGATIPCSLSPATKVVVFQWPCGIAARRRSPRGARPYRRALLVEAQVSSIKTSDSGSR